jgi:hypothetical protein
MEDVLSVYSRDFKQDEVLVCLDETSKQLVSETREGIPMKNGSVEKHDAEYKRNGTANIFMVNAPLEGERYVSVTEARKAIDYAEILRKLSDEIYPNKKKIILVQDNLNTHETASLYKRFSASEARRLAERFEFHYTPKHGSWLNIAEIELSVLSRQCTNRYFDNREELSGAVKFWEEDRNNKCKKVNWRFTTSDARIKLKHLYPIA